MIIRESYKIQMLNKAHLEKDVKYWLDTGYNVSENVDHLKNIINMQTVDYKFRIVKITEEVVYEN